MGYFLDRADPPCREPAITDRLLLAHRRSFFSVFIYNQCIPNYVIYSFELQCFHFKPENGL